MGTRAQIALKDGENRVYLYQHYDGDTIFKTLATALTRGRDRWSDVEYLARIIFSDMIRDRLDSTTGYGIGTSQHGDLSVTVPVLDCGTQLITWEGPRAAAHGAPISFQAFVEKYAEKATA